MSFSFQTYCRSLRKQHRIRLHVNLFLSFVFKEVMDILWDMLVTYDKVKSTTVFETTLLKNGVSTEYDFYSLSSTFVYNADL